MSSYDFMKDLASYIDTKAETFLKKNGIDESLANIKSRLICGEPIFKNNQVSAHEANYTEAYINELMTAIIKKVSEKNKTTYDEEYKNFREHYLQKNNIKPE